MRHASASVSVRVAPMAMNCLSTTSHTSQFRVSGACRRSHRDPCCTHFLLTLCCRVTRDGTQVRSAECKTIEPEARRGVRRGRRGVRRGRSRFRRGRSRFRRGRSRVRRGRSRFRRGRRGFRKRDRNGTFRTRRGRWDGSWCVCLHCLAISTTHAQVSFVTPYTSEKKSASD